MSPALQAYSLPAELPGKPSYFTPHPQIWKDLFKYLQLQTETSVIIVF